MHEKNSEKLHRCSTSNVTKRVCGEHYDKFYQTLIINVDFFKRFVYFVFNISDARANSKFQFVRVAVIKIHSQTDTTKQTLQKAQVS